jgi:arginine exporter protein ArgO
MIELVLLILRRVLVASPYIWFAYLGWGYCVADPLMFERVSWKWFFFSIGIAFLITALVLIVRDIRRFLRKG